jgi:hypothetical protein
MEHTSEDASYMKNGRRYCSKCYRRVATDGSKACQSCLRGHPVMNNDLAKGSVPKSDANLGAMSLNSLLSDFAGYVRRGDNDHGDKS